MNILIIGHGRMGKLVEQLAVQKGDSIVATIDNEKDWEMSLERLCKADVAIIFTIPQFATHYIMKCFELDIPVVIGTTGWNDKIDEIRKYAIANNKTILYSSNFSIGVNLMLKAVRYLSSIMEQFDMYDVHIEETHHVHKLDAPSGTAITLAEAVSDSKPPKIVSYREGEVIGEHKVIYESDIDTICLSHSAKSRNGLAFGAIMAARWIIGKKGFFTMDDVMSE